MYNAFDCVVILFVNAAAFSSVSYVYSFRFFGRLRLFCSYLNTVVKVCVVCVCVCACVYMHACTGVCVCVCACFP